MVAGVTVAGRPGGAQPAHAARVFVAGYYVHDDPLAATTLQAFGDHLAWTITTNLVISDTTGTLRGEHDARVMTLARQRGISVHFRVSNLTDWEFNREVAHAVLTHPEARARAIADIAATADEYGYDGVNIDLERVPPEDREALTGFTRDLTATLRAKGKMVSIAVPGKTTDDLTDPSSGAFDLEALGAIVDRIVLMAYDEHWDSGPPGPVASLPWVEAVVRYAVSQVSPDKLLLGVAFYGYDWPARGTGEGVSMREAMRRGTEAGAELQWDPIALVPFFRVGPRTIYFENARSLAHKLEVQANAGLAGIAPWRLGHELPEVWAEIGRTPAAQRP